jgi:hypothetical protein
MGRSLIEEETQMDRPFDATRGDRRKQLGYGSASAAARKQATGTFLSRGDREHPHAARQRKVGCVSRQRVADAEMSSAALQDHPPFAGHSPEQERPLGGYAVLMGMFAALCGTFITWMRTSGRELPETIETRDLALIAIATHKSSRLVARDRVTSTVRAPFTTFQDDAGPSEVDEAARGHGLRRAIGELLICPYCLSMWLTAGFIGGLVVAPRSTRWIASVFVTLTGADALQIAYAKAEQAL